MALKTTAWFMIFVVMAALAWGAGNDVVFIEVESDVEIPPLAYHDGVNYKPVHVIYVSNLETALWANANISVKIPTWDFKRAILAVPRDAFGKKPPRGFRGGVLRVYVNNTWVDLLEAPPGIVATYSYIDNVNKSEIKPFKGRAQWVERPKGRGPDKRPPRQAADEVGSSSEVAVEQVSSTQLATVYADGGFFYASLKNVYLYANVERCLPVLRVDDPTFSPTMYPTIAVLGYNATYMWRVYAAVYTSATGWLRPVGKMVVRVYEVHPELQSVGNKLGEWSFDVYNFLPSFSTGIPLSWPNRFVGLEICFRPSVSGVYYIVGANATVEFRKNSISYAGGNYVLGYSGTPISRFRFNKDTVLLGPVTLSDGFVNQRISISLGAGVVVNTPNCPTLTMDVYLGQNAQYWVGGLSVSASYYSYAIGLGYVCHYNIQYTTSSTIIGLWYDEARAASRGVWIKLKFNYPLYSIAIDRAVVSGERYAEHLIDKPNRAWTYPMLRGVYSTFNEYNTTFYQIYIRTTSAVLSSDMVDFYTTSGDGFRYIKLTYSPASAFRGVTVWYKDVQNLTPSEPWYEWLAREAASILLSILDLLGALPPGFTLMIDIITNVLQATAGSNINYYQSGNSIIIEWQRGLNDPTRTYVGVLIFSDHSYGRRIEVNSIDSRYVGNDFATALPSVSGLSPDYTPQLRHWLYGVRTTIDIPLVR